MKRFLYLLDFLIGCPTQASYFFKEEDFKKFKQKYSTIILTPLNGMGGESIYKFDESSTDHLEIFKSLTNNYQTMVMVQKCLT